MQTDGYYTNKFGKKIHIIMKDTYNLLSSKLSSLPEDYFTKKE